MTISRLVIISYSNDYSYLQEYPTVKPDFSELICYEASRQKERDVTFLCIVLFSIIYTTVISVILQRNVCTYSTKRKEPSQVTFYVQLNIANLRVVIDMTVVTEIRLD